MRKLLLSLLAICFFFPAFTQAIDSTAQSLIKKTDGLLGKIGRGKTSTVLSNDDIIGGLKEALTVGAKNSVSKLSAADGFLKDAAVKILMPEEAKKVEQKLRQLGMGKLVDDAIVSMNRAAEDASSLAAPVFFDAIKKMNVQDGLNILRGTDTAATGYLRKTTAAELMTAFHPIIENSLQKTGATHYWKEVFETYNKFSFKPVNPDLSNYVASKALDGIFHYVANEEKKIRKDPAARVTDILKKVFSSK